MEVSGLRWPIWIGVICDDLDEQRRFYRDVLGMRELQVGDGWVWFDFGGGKLFELLQRSDEPQYQSRRYQVGFEVDDIHAAREELVRRGVEAVTDGIEGGEEATEYWCYFKDAEGNLFEVVQKIASARRPS